jgi:small subunit ribosomal protein S20
MPKIKSAKKRVAVSLKRHGLNTSRKSSLKTAIKKVMDALASSDLDTAKKLFVDAESAIARAKGKGVLHKNTAARKVSRLSKKLRAVEKPSA